MSSTQNTNFSNCNRRDFLKAAGIGAAAMAFPMGLLRNANAASNTDMGQEIVETDVLIIGGGIAGIFAALKAKDQGLDVTIADKGTVGRSGLSPWFGAYNYYDPASSGTRANWRAKKSHGGEYLTNMDYVDLFIEESQARYKDMVAMGADKANPGGHVAVLKEKVMERDIKLVERTMITELIKKDNRITGAVGFPMDEDKAVVIGAKAVILCAGSGAFKTPGFPIGSLTHDGDAMAYRIGAEISGKEFIDFHWTHWENPAACYDNWKGDLGHDLNVNTSPDGGLPPLSNAISAHNGQVPLFIKGPEPEKGKKLPPGLAVGQAPPGVRSVELPIVGGATAGMAPHKSEGIFPQNAKFESNITGLFAAGDALCTEGAAYHGFGSSSSNSAVQGARSGVYAAEYAKKSGRVSVTARDIKTIKKRIFEPRTRKQGYSPEWVTQVLQGMMVPYYVLYVKKQDRLEGALANLSFLRDHFAPNLIANDTHELRLAHEVKNMLLNAEMKLKASLFRTESRGAHYREDFPARDDKNWLAWVIISRDGDTMKLSKRLVPNAWKPKASLSYKARYANRFPGEEEYLTGK
ncbi:succinate dehydrogenase/fumarate reductase flavoprotein subunit [Desulfobacter hydrogenophilus]|uniref:FAD-binding protein n=1 Tax=Desulfobacter hydrogenophilus TaxID=2291 RepID=A0A328F6Q8_9BACT|nr:FAD-binding protein [Desulfobacter hydrogenophilus]NDY74163.1 FAD-binding protein [Desulfobacter hydrogenophilus]QBH12588.1 FAD-binding protein [Desulfobacter hydrogenophilus]RAM00231.1 succinate dehydrogenase/fumarate reductase flavoprotein subunit [Desulfobacter hydrogenophilus]